MVTMVLLLAAAHVSSVSRRLLTHPIARKQTTFSYEKRKLAPITIRSTTFSYESRNSLLYLSGQLLSKQAQGTPLRTIPHSRRYSHLQKQNTQPSSSRDFTVWKMLSQAREGRDCHSCQSHFRNVLHALGSWNCVNSMVYK